MISKLRMNVGAYLEVKERTAFLLYPNVLTLTQFLERENHGSVLL